MSENVKPTIEDLKCVKALVERAISLEVEKGITRNNFVVITGMQKARAYLSGSIKVLEDVVKT